MTVMVGYAIVASACNVTEEQVREDRKKGLLDLDDFKSIVLYSAQKLGWKSPEEQAQAPAPVIAAVPVPPALPERDPYLDRVKSVRYPR